MKTQPPIRGQELKERKLWKDVLPTDLSLVATIMLWKINATVEFFIEITANIHYEFIKSNLFRIYRALKQTEKVHFWISYKFESGNRMVFKDGKRCS